VRGIGCLAAIFAFGLILVFAGGYFRGATSPEDARKQIPSMLQAAYNLDQQGRGEEALNTLTRALIISPQDKGAMALAMKIHSSLNEYLEAAAIANELAEIDIPNAGEILVKAFDWNLRGGGYEAAEANLNRAIELVPDNVTVRRLLAQFLNAQGRRFETREHVLHLIRLLAVLPDEILSLIDLSGPCSLASFDELINPSEINLFALGNARYRYIAMLESPQEVLDLLSKITDKYPSSAAAAAFRGRVLAESGRVKDLNQWFMKLPAGIEQHPEYWRACGEWLVFHDRHAEAVRAFGEAIRRDASDRGSLRSLVRSLEEMGKNDQAESVRERLAVLDQIFRIARDAKSEDAAWISSKLNEMVRPWESFAWRMYSAQLAGQFTEKINEMESRHASVAAWERKASLEQIRNARLQRILGFSIEPWPMPDLEAQAISSPPKAVVQRSNNLQFKDVAKESGIQTQFISNFPLDGGKLYAYQINGGGLAVLDYDHDGQSDLYVVQSGGRPNDRLSSEANQLFRCGSSGIFSEVTQTSGTGDRGYGQGVCAGDVNQDGFTDLLVANIGANVMYINQGDGTFIQASHLITPQWEAWTSSIALADLNGDHLPEIIEINYIDDPRARSGSCETTDPPCQPQRFNAATDRFWRCLPDGQFVPWVDDAESRVLAKFGLGLVIANFDRHDGNDVFVSNDGDLNHFWASKKALNASSDKYQLVESAVIRGCSIGRGGNSQACMGIGAGDFDRNGMLDLHVTNFYHEPVNLFLQNQAGYFTDEALKFRLTEPSFDVLGFGTQAMDFDNNGWLDLAVLNGHVYEPKDGGVPFRMRAQLLKGSEDGFSLQEASLGGDYWQIEQLGRTLALLDWNRDGRMDMVTNHLDTPIALLENQSKDQHWLQIELVGVISERDAIGAEVQVKAGAEQWTGWQMGGDGYMCTNEPVIHFGLGDCSVVDRVEVRWPSGQTQVFNNLEIDGRFLVIEGEGELLRR